MEDSASLRIYMPREQRRKEYLSLLSVYGFSSERIVEKSDLERAAGAGKNSCSFETDFVVLDRRSTGAGEYEFFSSLGVPVGLDEGGPLRRSFPFLVDTFPLPAEYGEANTSDPGFLDLPEKKREYPEEFSRILVSFGGEDPAGLTESVLEVLGTLADEPESMLPMPARITVVEGPLFGRECALPDSLQKLEKLQKISVEIVRAPRTLTPLYGEHDLVLTTFGLTAYEAAAAGAGVILFHPSEYHRSLARNAGFAEVASIRRAERDAFESLLGDPARVVRATASAVPVRRVPLSDVLLSLSPPKITGCPHCCSKDDITAQPPPEPQPQTQSQPQPEPQSQQKAAPPSALYREKDRTFFRCGECGLVYQVNFTESGSRYGREYFFLEYREQYGRSYLEDAEHIRSLARPRLDRINAMVKGKVKLLDVGCAYGPFIQEAAAHGHEVSGIDISSDAAEYVRSTLGFTAFTGDFSTDPPPGDILTTSGESFDVITMWYVIEHFEGLDRVLERVHALLKPGGVFAFSTPNLRGISGRRDTAGFLHSSPRDHHTLWSPPVAAEILGKRGFHLEKTVSTGHHPERFPILEKHYSPSKSEGGIGPSRRQSEGAAGRGRRYRRKGESRRVHISPLFHFFMGISKIFGMGDSFEVYARKNGERK
ncbi:MAG: class I SAM-dependent methyltransferase [Spirochaetia bacterium]